MPHDPWLKDAKEKQYVLEQWMIDRLKEEAKRTKRSESAVLREILAREFAEEYEAQCDADGCEAVATHTDGQMNWCDTHWTGEASEA